MKAKFLITAAIAVLSFAALAGAHAATLYTEGSGHELSIASSSTLSRSDVRADAAAAYAAGLIPQGENPMISASVGTAKTRAQVRAELAEALRLGLVQPSVQEVVFPTAAQILRIEMAGLRALHMTVASR